MGESVDNETEEKKERPHQRQHQEEKEEEEEAQEIVLTSKLERGTTWREAINYRKSFGCSKGTETERETEMETEIGLILETAWKTFGEGAQNECPSF
jgi:hypothetical protein